MGGRKTSMAAGVIAACVAAAGGALLVAGLMTPVAFGWFAYQPLSGATFVPGAHALFLSHLTIIGWAILTIGLLAVAFLAGVRAGRGRED